MSRSEFNARLTMRHSIDIVVPLLAHVVLPLMYLVLCGWMFRRRVWWFTFIAFFFVFGSFGGWLFMLEWANGPVSVASYFFLVTGAIAACLASSLVLQFRKDRNAFDYVAMLGGYCFVGLFVAFNVAAFVG